MSTIFTLIKFSKYCSFSKKYDIQECICQVFSVNDLLLHKQLKVFSIILFRLKIKYPEISTRRLDREFELSKDIVHGVLI